jgi:hypothetical protein
MAQTNDITVTVYPTGEALAEHPDGLTFDNVHYISLIAFNTFGIPAVISEQARKSEGLPLRVLYINPANVTAVEAVRLS